MRLISATRDTRVADHSRQEGARVASSYFGKADLAAHAEPRSRRQRQLIFTLCNHGFAYMLRETGDKLTTGIRLILKRRTPRELRRAERSRTGEIYDTRCTK